MNMNVTQANSPEAKATIKDLKNDKKVADLKDENGDISNEKVVKLAEEKGMSTEEAKNFVKDLDKDEDGKISEKEINMFAGDILGDIIDNLSGPAIPTSSA